MSRTRFGFAALIFLLPQIFPSRLVGETKARRIHETSHILSMLKSSNMDLSRPRAVAEAIWRESRKYSLDPMLVLAVIKVESEFRSEAVSIYGARGLMQLLPTVAHVLAEEADLEEWEGPESLHNPVTNVKLGAFYLGYLQERFGDLKVALTAYNQGPTSVQRMLESRAALSFDYARKVLSISRNYREQGRQHRAGHAPI